MSFAPLVLLYNSIGSKTVVELFCHALPSGSYPFMQTPHKVYDNCHILNLFSRLLMPLDILDCLNINTSFSCCGRDDAHQGLDFILEEYDRNIFKKKNM